MIFPVAVILGSLVATSPLVAQSAAVRAAADLVGPDPLSGRAVTQRGTITRPSDPLPVLDDRVFASGYSMVAPPGGEHSDYIQFHCQVGDGPWETLPASVDGMSVRRAAILGHSHGGTVPLGRFEPTRGHTDPALKFPTTYSTPEVAVNEYLDVNFTYDKPDHPCDGYSFVATFALSARVKGLIPLGITQFMVADPIGYGHASPLFVEPSFGQKVQAMSAAYYMSTRRRVRVHTASLPQGGLFDIGGDFSSPFGDHRRGTDIDVSGGRHPQAVEKLVEAGLKVGLVCATRGAVVQCSNP